MGPKVTVASLIAGIGGAVTFLFSFFDFLGSGNFGRNAWSSDFLMMPFATIVAILGLAMAVVVVLEITGTKLPSPILTFTWGQIKVTWGIVAVVLMLGWLIADTDPASLKIGGIFMLLGSIAMAVGAIMGVLGMASNTVNLGGGDNSGSQAPPPPPAGGQAPPPPPPSA